MSAPSRDLPPARLDDAACCVCARSAIGFGYAPRDSHGRVGSPIIWVCDDPDCLDIAKDSYEMKQGEFDRVEAMAVIDGLECGRRQAMEIGTSDLAEMTDDQRLDFARAIVAGYRSALKVKIRDEAPF
ncbi:hypothetical protein [Jiella avicenniae]|uniref:Uncharacterized protein n=1 Tax=Jiella avicenniae TaxID=2907202 RepID=A0A9X1P167_9HYPH|nr:hypothetical protein [Jiella avicenniae]MCE7028460.1 hypothetical protein [Jiella avicenniae]